MPGVAGQVTLVTGGASGIGRATGSPLREKAQNGGQQTVHMITENGGDATFVQVDVS
jgi:NAD(P)-dependent dehydrogenase (short-subunit alcohol dehydrogenase family)